jgi:hypothetical protein
MDTVSMVDMGVVSTAGMVAAFTAGVGVLSRLFTDMDISPTATTVTDRTQGAALKRRSLAR